MRKQRDREGLRLCERERPQSLAIVKSINKRRFEGLRLKSLRSIKSMLNLNPPPNIDPKVPPNLIAAPSTVQPERQKVRGSRKLDFEGG
jgi:hypothetical protein